MSQTPVTSQTLDRIQTRQRLWLTVVAALLLSSCKSLPAGNLNQPAQPSPLAANAIQRSEADVSERPRTTTAAAQAAHRRIVSAPSGSPVASRTAGPAEPASGVALASYNGPLAPSKKTPASGGRRGARRDRRGGFPGHNHVRLTAPPCPVCSPDTAYLGGSYCDGHDRLKPLRLQDEYVCDGGDHVPDVRVGQDGRLYGLELEDTVAHFRTEEGETKVQASNRVCIYSPSFAAVRKVASVLQHEQHQAGLPLRRRVGIREDSDNQIATTAIQPLQPISQHGHRTLQAVKEQLLAITFENEVKLSAASSNLLPFEDVKLVRAGIYDNSQKVRLATSMQNAVSWNGDQRVQVVLDEKMAFEYNGDVKPQLMHRFDMPKGKPRLRVAKLASKQNALPGEEVEFTIRFDNVGDQLLDKVTIVDNLTRRLEYVADSAQCSLDAEFKSTDNAQESLILSWTLAKPLDVNEGGVIRFKCRLR